MWIIIITRFPCGRVSLVDLVFGEAVLLHSHHWPFNNPVLKPPLGIPHGAHQCMKVHENLIEIIFRGAALPDVSSTLAWTIWSLLIQKVMTMDLIQLIFQETNLILERNLLMVKSRMVKLRMNRLISQVLGLTKTNLRAIKTIDNYCLGGAPFWCSSLFTNNRFG